MSNDDRKFSIMLIGINCKFFEFKLFIQMNMFKWINYLFNWIKATLTWFSQTRVNYVYALKSFLANLLKSTERNILSVVYVLAKHKNLLKSFSVVVSENSLCIDWIIL